MVKRSLLVGAILAALMGATSTASATRLPEIQQNARNVVPDCVTPERMMSFVRARNDDVDRQFHQIAAYYEHHGEKLGVRWDMAFFQMIVETNWLRFHRANGRPGLVSPDQNNFAGLGATGRGQNGAAFADVSTGVLAHLQHVLLYSGTHIENPVARRTALVQEWDIVGQMVRGLGRPATFSDLTRMWSPNDRGYAADIRAIAMQYGEKYCMEKEAQVDAPAITGRVEPRS
jgi:hypothetical protein